MPFGVEILDLEARGPRAPLIQYRHNYVHGMFSLPLAASRCLSLTSWKHVHVPCKYVVGTLAE